MPDRETLVIVAILVLAFVIYFACTKIGMS